MNCKAGDSYGPAWLPDLDPAPTKVDGMTMIHSDDKFKGRYEVSDGYAGGSRPHNFTFFAGDLEDDMTDADLVNEYEAAAQQHFEENISPSVSRVDEFIAWARERLAERAAAEIGKAP